MIPYKSHRPMAVPNTLEARLEILKAIRSLMSQEAVQKFDDSQPRVAAGNPGGGQWTSEGGAAQEQTTRLAARRISPAREAECEEQYKRDVFQCKMVGLSACYAQAMLRYANCLQGLPIPPLNY